jgi:uracil-DNA glycosylase
MISEQCFNIPYNFEEELHTFIEYGDNDIDFIGQSYLLNNKIHLNWFPFFKQNEKLLNGIFSKLSKMKKIYPTYNNIFNAFQINPDNIKVILLGQDPYINENQAHGYSFSVPVNEKIPPSLINIFKELNNEYPNKYNFTHGNLEKWSNNQGIFLLNGALTVKPKESFSHAEIWEEFTNNVIEYLSETYSNKVFLLLGKFAKSKNILIDEDKHKIVYGVHPSPMSAHNGFFNSGIFKKVDDELISMNIEPVNWEN